MNRFILLVCFGLYSTCSMAPIRNLPDSIQEKLAFELAQIYAFDQGIRDYHIMKTYREEWTKITPAIDSINFNKFVAIVQEYGFPGKAILGKYYSHESVSSAAIVVLLHNPKRLVEPEMYQLFRNEVLEGRLNASLFAEALDKYHVFFEGRSLYNSQFKKYPKLEIKGVCITHRELSDSLRKDIGLLPLTEEEFIYSIEQSQ
jgi:hypothetical protein